jgi:flavoprotein
VLEYSGFGDLHGIPGVCVSRLTNAVVSCGVEGARYVPSFVIPYDATAGSVSDGSKTYLVKWLDREIRFAQKPLSACSAAGLAVPTNVTLPTASDLKDPTDPSSDVYIGAKPTVTSAPRVIHGDVKY